MNNSRTITLGDALKESRPTAFSTMVKPAGSACNLDCSYCYYLDKAVQYGGKEAVSRFSSVWISTARRWSTRESSQVGSGY